MSDSSEIRAGKTGSIRSVTRSTINPGLSQSDQDWDGTQSGCDLSGRNPCARSNGALYAQHSLSPWSYQGDSAGLSCGGSYHDVLHTGTHIDALCQIGEALDKNGNPDPAGEIRLYAGPGKTVTAADQVGLNGQEHFSIAEMPPIVQRGVLLDDRAQGGCAELRSLQTSCIMYRA
jgi:hypothetical protein